MKVYRSSKRDGAASNPRKRRIVISLEFLKQLRRRRRSRVRLSQTWTGTLTATKKIYSKNWSSLRTFTATTSKSLDR